METKDVSGAAVVFQSGGPTRVINASLEGICNEISIYLTGHLCAKNSPKITSLYGSLDGLEGILRERFTELVDEKGNCHEDLLLLKNTPGAALGTSRRKLYRKEKYKETKEEKTILREQDCHRAINVLKEHGIHYVFGIGGNDTAETSLILARFAEQEKYPLVLIHIPKTIDNDLRQTDHSPGYGSAARYVMSYVAGTHLDMVAMKKTIDISVAMGRNAGWLTASASLVERLGIEPPLIFVPENPMAVGEFVEAVAEEYGKKGYCQAVVSEGMKTPDGEEEGGEWVDILAEGNLAKDSQGRNVFSRTPLANLLEEEIKSRIDGARVVPNQLGYGQRSFLCCYSETDLKEAEEVGKTAVRYALQGKTGVMAGLKRNSGSVYRCEPFAVDLDLVADPGKELIQTLPAGYVNAVTNRMNSSFIDYAAPLADVDSVDCIARLSLREVGKKLPDYKPEK